MKDATAAIQLNERCRSPSIRPSMEAVSVKTSALGSSSDEGNFENAGPAQEQILPPMHIKVIIFTGLCMVWFARGADSTMTTTMGTVVATRFDAFDLIGWFGAADLLPQAVLSVGMGKLATLVKTRILATAGNVLMIAGGVTCIVAKSGVAFIMGRLITGIGLAVLLPLGASVVTEILTPSQRPFFFAIIVGVDVLALSAGGLIGGIFTDKVDYRWAFVITMGLVTIAVVMVLASFKESEKKHHQYSIRRRIDQFDPVGFSLLLLATTTVLVGLHLPSDGFAWSSALVIALLAVSGVALVLFVAQQIYHPRPDERFLPAGMFSRDVILVLCMGFFVVFNTFQTTAYLSTYYQTVQQLTAFRAGIALLGFLLPTGISSLVIAGVIPLVPYANIVLLFGTSVSIIGQVLLARIPSTATVLQVSLMSIAAGVGTGSSQMLGVVYSQKWVSDDLQPFMASFALTMQLLGGTTGYILGEMLLNTQVRARVMQDAGLSSQVRQSLSDNITKLSLQDLDPASWKVVKDILLESHRVVFLCGTAAAVLAWFMALSVKWRRV